MARKIGITYDQKLKVVKLKSMAEALLFIQNHDFADFDALSDYANAASGRTKELTAKIKAAESRMAEIAVLKTHIINYAKTRDIYTAYRKAGYSRKYYDVHESDILIHKAAKKAFDDLALNKLPTVCPPSRACKQNILICLCRRNSIMRRLPRHARKPDSSRFIRPTPRCSCARMPTTSGRQESINRKNSTATQGAAEREPFDQSGVWGEFPQHAKGDFRHPEISLFVKFV